MADRVLRLDVLPGSSIATLKCLFSRNDFIAIEAPCDALHELRVLLHGLHVDPHLLADLLDLWVLNHPTPSKIINKTDPRTRMHYTNN